MLKRRAVLASIAVAPFSSVVCAQQVRPIVMVTSAWDCPPCLRWHKEYEGDWKKTEQFKRLEYALIEMPSLHQIPERRNWTGSYTRYWPFYEAFLKDQENWMRNDMRNGIYQKHVKTVPRFFVVVDRKLRSVTVGRSGWAETVDLLRQLTGA